MNISKYLDEMRNIQDDFLEFIEDEEKIEENFKNLKNQFDDMKIRDNKQELRLVLHFISCICDNHFRGPNFFEKIERTLLLFKEEIKKYYSNSEIFNIFKKNKRILLFLIKEGIMIIDKHIAKIFVFYTFQNKKYPEYFWPEIKPFVNERWFPKYILKENFQKELPEDFYENRYKAENESYICKLIREDSVIEFITYYTKKNIKPDATVNKSIYETNQFLLKKQKRWEDVTLIQYAAFFGSIQIFTFLKNENAKLTPSLWLFAIHGKNAELIHLLEELFIESTTANEKGKEDEPFKKCCEESIKCYHNEIANYFINNYPQNENGDSKSIFFQSLKYYNFTFLQNEQVNESSFCYLCHFDYYAVVKYLLASKNIDVNSKVIQNHIIQSNSKLYHSIEFKIISFNRIQNYIIQ